MFLTLVAMIAAPAAAAAHADLIGHYTLVDERGRIVCKLRMLYEPSVGGEVDAPKACAKALPVADGLRWYVTADGGYSIRNALHREVATVVETEAGYVLNVGGLRYDLAAPDYVPAPPAATRAVGLWKVLDNDAKLLCRVRFSAGGAVGPTTASCPAVVRPFGSGRWRADQDGITLTATGGRSFRLDWEDEDELAGDNLHLAFARDRSK